MKALALTLTVLVSAMLCPMDDARGADVSGEFALDARIEGWARDTIAPNGAVYDASRVLSDLGGPAGAALFTGIMWSADSGAGQNAVAALAYSAAVVYVLKIWIGRARPDQDEIGFYGPSFADGRHSMPSGHAASAFALATVAAHHFPRYGAAAYALATAVAASRIALGRHWFTDVAVGGAIGAAIGRAAVEGRLEWIWEW